MREDEGWDSIYISPSASPHRLSLSLSLCAAQTVELSATATDVRVRGLNLGQDKVHTFLLDKLQFIIGCDKMQQVLA